MKETTIKWHSVETDGLPEESGDYLVRTKCYGYFDGLPYSAVHQLFGVYDAEDEYDADVYQIEVDWWAELPNLDEE